MNKIFALGFIISLILVGCSEPNMIGLEVQPTSDNIIVSSTDFDNFISHTESEDSLRSDEAVSLILGEITEDDVFENNRALFYTQILLTENNIDLGSNPIVDSVILSYTYSGYYGDLQEFSSLEVIELSEAIHKDSIYYSNSEIINANFPINLVESFSLNTDELAPMLKIKLTDSLGQKILNYGNEALIDNEVFLQNFHGLAIAAQAQNTILYLNPAGTNSYFTVYYHNDNSGADTLSLDFELAGDAARINIFNEKNENSIIDDQSRIYIQSMAGYKAKILINNIDSIKSLLYRKVINKVVISFDIEPGTQSDYEAHQKLVLVRVTSDGDNVFLSDFTIEGEAYFGGNLENDGYEFNITRYFFQLLNNESYTNNLYLLPAGASVNANRTILSNEIKLQIYYSKL